MISSSSALAAGVTLPEDIYFFGMDVAALAPDRLRNHHVIDKFTAHGY